MATHVKISEASSIEIDRLSQKVLKMLDETSSDKRIVIGISGVPGSGKSTLARMARVKINELYKGRAPDAGDIAVDIPMDGFHYTRAQLAAMPDPATAVHRRGAAFTFDGEGFHNLIKLLTATPIQSVQAPSFDHALKDPVDDAILISQTAHIVLVEGNYCALDRKPWSEAAGLMTELWYVDIPAAVAHKRVALRHIESKICATEADAWERATGTDELNAQDVRNNRLPCHETIVFN